MDEYCRIFELNCRKRGLAFDPVMVEYLRAHATTSRASCRCAPAIRATWSSRSSTSAATRTRRRSITRELLDMACGSYFLEETESQGAGA